MKYARRDLCGGCSVMGIPTAIASDCAVNRCDSESWAFRKGPKTTFLSTFHPTRCRDYRGLL